ncbi:MAG TPA: M48 family metalloprotease [Bryobacteraceae bacterium]|nr:M48 family metalloprotease [Bryobacteraceae bacterium]
MLLALPAMAELQQLRPGFNLFSAQQDVQLGQEAAREVPKQMTVLRNRDLDAYLDVLLRKLEKSRYARTLNRDGSRSELFPFSIHAVHDKKINAFSLPGGPLFVNTGAIDAADNEAQLAGVIAHEMSHVVLRHMTNQASKRGLVALPAVLAGAVAGHSLLGQMAQLGIIFTANSALLKFSRTDEAEADYNGAEMMADAGYNPIEMARFFEKLEDKARRGAAIEQFLSDHPNPGNRIAAISDEARDMPRRNYMDDETGQLGHARDVVRKLPVPTQSAPAPSDLPSKERVTFEGRSFSLRYPGNWQVQRGDKPDVVTIGPRGGLLPEAVGYGLQTNYFVGDSDGLIQELRRANPEMRVAREARSIDVDGQTGSLNTLDSRSPYGGGEVDVLVTVARPEGLFYIVFIAPKAEFEKAQMTFEEVLRSVRFR